MSDESQCCARCARWEDASSFLGSSGKLLATCESCRSTTRARNRRSRQRRGPDAVRADNLLQKYGITPEEYDALRAAQDYRCAICRTPESEIQVHARGRPRLDGQPTAAPFALLVDHCHESTRVRGLLCFHCNSALGYFRDSPERLLAAVRYLEEHRWGMAR